MASKEDIEAEDEFDSDELPTHEKLLVVEGLYEEHHLGEDYHFVKRMFDGPDLQFDCHCVWCGQSSTFRQVITRGGGAGLAPPNNSVFLNDRRFTVEMACQRNTRHKYFFHLEVKSKVIQKVGQSPPIADISIPHINRYGPLLDKQWLAELKRGAGLHAHGIGVGSLVYLRRVFEMVIKTELEAARKDGHPLEGFERLRFDEKMDALAFRLPAAVTKYQAIYKALSAGIHTLDEDTCRTYFPILLGVLYLILDDHLEARRKKLADDALDKEFHKVMEDVKKKGDPQAKTTPPSPPQRKP